MAKHGHGSGIGGKVAVDMINPGTPQPMEENTGFYKIDQIDQQAPIGMTAHLDSQTQGLKPPLRRGHQGFEQVN
jgi:hypothetical protein